MRLWSVLSMRLRAVLTCLGSLLFQIGRRPCCTLVSESWALSLASNSITLGIITGNLNTQELSHFNGCQIAN